MIMRAIFNLMALLAVLVGILFLPAGRWDWLEAWLFIGAYGFILAYFLLWGLTCCWSAVTAADVVKRV